MRVLSHSSTQKADHGHHDAGAHSHHLPHGHRGERSSRKNSSTETAAARIRAAGLAQPVQPGGVAARVNQFRQAVSNLVPRGLRSKSGALESQISPVESPETASPSTAERVRAALGKIAAPAAEKKLAPHQVAKRELAKTNIIDKLLRAVQRGVGLLKPEAEDGSIPVPDAGRPEALLSIVGSGAALREAHHTACEFKALGLMPIALKVIAKINGLAGKSGLFYKDLARQMDFSRV